MMTFCKNLSLYDFRSYTQRSFDFTSDQIVFWGGNGRGKTNIIEALFVISLGKSWREHHGSDLISHDAQSAKIEAAFGEDIYQVQIKNRGRLFFKNEKKISLRQHIGQINSLLFCPEHLGLFVGPKTHRLKFFDRFLVQIFPEYRNQLLTASKAHKQKVTLLRNFSNDANLQAMIQPWNQILSETIPTIIHQRKSFLESIRSIFQKQLSTISGKKDDIDIQFECTERFDCSEAGILDFFAREKFREQVARKNLIAPHSGDFQFYLRGKKINQTASRGEIRSVLLALLSAQKEYLQQQTHSTPILLLDDVFSELDDDRQKHLEQLCEGTQTFFTTTHQEHFQNFSKKVQAIAI